MYKFSKAIAQVSFCPECLEKDKEMADLVKDYVAKNRNCNVSEVAKEFNVPLNRVRGFLKGDFVGIKGENHGFLVCEGCGKPINWGKYCNSCDQVNDTASKPQIQSKGVLMKAHLHKHQDR